MSIGVTQNADVWVPVVATNVNTGEPRTGIVYTEVDCAYKKANQSVFTPKVLTPTNFREVGEGVYEVKFLAADVDVLGIFLYLVKGNGTLAPPAISQYLGELDVALAPGQAMAGQRYRETVTDNFGNAMPYVMVNIYTTGTANLLASKQTNYNGYVEFDLIGVLNNPGLVDIEFLGGGIEAFRKEGVKLA